VTVLIAILPWHIATKPQQRDPDLGFECWRLEDNHFREALNWDLIVLDNKQTGYLF
jgi:hypothetical protein